MVITINASNLIMNIAANPHIRTTVIARAVAVVDRTAAVGMVAFASLRLRGIITTANMLCRLPSSLS